MVLDTAVWRNDGSYGRSEGPLRRAPQAKPGGGGRWPRVSYGLPAIHGGDVAELTAATERASMLLAAHIDDQPPQLDLPDGIRFGLVQPRHLHGDWDTHQAAQKRAREARAAERDAEVRRSEDARLRREQAQARIRAVLPDHPIVTPIYGTGLPKTPTLTWKELADLLDAYADARPAAALNAGEGA